MRLHDRIMHTCLKPGDHALTRSNASACYPYEAVAGARVVLDVRQSERVDRVFQVLSEGGRVEMPLQETFRTRGSA